MKSINVVYMISNNFHELTVESIKYINLFYKDTRRLTIYIVHIDDIPTRSRHNGAVYVRIDADIPIDHRRAYLPEILEIDKFIYLDSDTMIHTCISKLWDIDIGNNIIAACTSYDIQTFSKMRTIYKEIMISDECLSDEYFNIGVLLVDAIRWRADNITQKCERALCSYSGTRHEKIAEPAFNIALRKKWKKLDELWNWKPRVKYVKPNIVHYYGQFFSQKPRHNAFRV